MFWPKAEADKYKTCLVICENQETHVCSKSFITSRPRSD